MGVKELTRILKAKAPPPVEAPEEEPLALPAVTLTAALPPIPGSRLEAFEERAAIMEFEGNMTREEAETQAYMLIVGKGR